MLAWTNMEWTKAFVFRWNYPYILRRWRWSNFLWLLSGLHLDAFSYQFCTCTSFALLMSYTFIYERSGKITQEFSLQGLKETWLVFHLVKIKVENYHIFRFSDLKMIFENLLGGIWFTVIGWLLSFYRHLLLLGDLVV